MALKRVPRCTPFWDGSVSLVYFPWRKLRLAIPKPIAPTKPVVLRTVRRLSPRVMSFYSNAAERDEYAAACGVDGNTNCRKINRMGAGKPRGARVFDQRNDLTSPFFRRPSMKTLLRKHLGTNSLAIAALCLAALAATSTARGAAMCDTYFGSGISLSRGHRDRSYRHGLCRHQRPRNSVVQQRRRESGNFRAIGRLLRQPLRPGRRSLGQRLRGEWIEHQSVQQQWQHADI